MESDTAIPRPRTPNRAEHFDGYPLELGLLLLSALCSRWPRVHVASRNGSDAASIQPGQLQTSSPPNLQPELSIGHASGAAGRAAIYQRLFKRVRPQARGRAAGFSATTKVKLLGSDGARCWGAHSPAGTLHLAGKGLAWGIWPGDTGSPAANIHLELGHERHRDG